MDSGNVVGANGLGGGLGQAAVSLAIYDAWADRPWVNDGAAVRVSLVCFAGRQSGLPVYLDGQPVNAIHADLTAASEAGSQQSLALTQAKPLTENAGLSFQGSQKIGAFDIPGDLARSWLGLPNVNGKPSSEVVKPSWNGMDLTRRPRDGWIIDFGTDMTEGEAAGYETPFQYVLEHVKPEREQNNREAYRKYWWRHGEPRVAMRAALAGLPRYIAKSATAKHPFFSWIPQLVLPDKALIVIACSDDTTFGVLHSRFHEVWALRMGTSLEDRPRYTPTTTFETFPFPDGVLSPIEGNAEEPCRAATLCRQEEDQAHCRDDDAGCRYGDAGLLVPGGVLSPIEGNAKEPCRAATLCRQEEDQADCRHDDAGCRHGDADLLDSTPYDPDPHFPAIAEAARNLDTLRNNCLNPPQWVDWEQTKAEMEAGFPKRPVAKPGHEADLKQRTLTNLYNQRPAWLVNTHQTLDKAVAAAYRWHDYTPDWTDEDILSRLLALNLARSQGQARTDKD